MASNLLYPFFCTKNTSPKDPFPNTLKYVNDDGDNAYWPNIVSLTFSILLSLIYIFELFFYLISDFFAVRPFFIKISFILSDRQTSNGDLPCIFFNKLLVCFSKYMTISK
jgi:hypothetical protein